MIIFAQAQENRRTSSIIPKGPVTMTITPLDEPLSLEQLTVKADLIVDGMVTTTLPSVTLSTRNPHSVATDSLIEIRKVIGGTVPANAHAIAVSQMGGKVGTAEAVVEDEPLLQAGERYVLFLKRDEQRAVPNTSGAPRYAVLGVWVGKAKVVNEKIQFSPKVAPSFRNREGSDVQTFIAAVEKILAEKNTPRI